jgi:hypothetical protein
VVAKEESGGYDLIFRFTVEEFKAEGRGRKAEVHGG